MMHVEEYFTRVQDVFNRALVVFGVSVNDSKLVVIESEPIWP